MQEDVIMASVSFPKVAVEVVIIIRWLRPVDVCKVSTKEICKDYDTGKWGQCRYALAADDIGDAKRSLWFAFQE